MEIKCKKNLVPFFCTIFILILTQLAMPMTSITDYSNSKKNAYNQLQKQKVSPNPDVYPEFYNKTVEKADNGKMMAEQAPIKEFAGEKESVAQEKSAPNTGDAEKVLVIPVQFTDTTFSSSHNQTYFQGIMDQLKDYYEKNSEYISDSAGITINYTVASAVTSSRTLAYYGGDGATVGSDDVNVEIYELAREAVKLADPTTDFSQYDTDSDGKIDHLFIIHAGNGQEDSGAATDIWSHRWGIPFGEIVDSVSANGYVCVPETGTLGVFAHEFGHDIGLPDLYDSDHIENGFTYGAGDWDVMGTGSWNNIPGDEPGTCPANLSAWSRELLGWNSVTDVTANSTYSLTNTNSNNTAYRFWTNGATSGNEYYLSEYRRKNGYDAGLPGEGVLIWHIDKQWMNTSITIEGRTGTILNLNKVNAYEDRLGVELEQADGEFDLWYLRNTGDASDPFPGDHSNNSFSAIPYGLNYSNITPTLFSYVDVRNISTVGATATMDINVTAAAPDSAPAQKTPADGCVKDIQTTVAWHAVTGAKSYKLQISENSSFTPCVEYNLDKASNIYYNNGLYSFSINSQNGKTYYWRIQAVNDSGAGPWSLVRSFITKDTLEVYLPSPQTPFRSSATDTSISIAWNDVAGATGYYLLADGIEVFWPTSSYNHIEVDSNIIHKYSVRAVNSTTTSLWSQELSAVTDGTPSISVTAQNVSEGNEHAGTINIELSNATFIEDGIYNKATVTMNPTALPQGVKQGAVTRNDPTHLSIALVGDSTIDYDSNISIVIKVAKEELSRGRYADTTGNALFYAVNEAQPGVPDPPIPPAGGGGGVPAGDGSPPPPVSPVVPSAATTSSAITIPTFGDKELGGQIDDPNSRNVIATISSSTAQAIMLNISTFDEIMQKGKSFTVDSPRVDITFPAGAVDQALIKAAGADAQLKIGMTPVSAGNISQKLKDAAQDDGVGLFAIGGCIYEFSSQIISSNKTQVITGFNAPVTITISLRDANLSSIDVDKLGAYCYNETTKVWEYIGGVYNPAARTITFTTTHFSLYSVMKYERTFSDIKTHWAKVDIEKLAAKYITNGVGGDKFNPEGTVTRAEFISWLVRATGAGNNSSQSTGMKSSQAQIPFTDVKSGKWYAGEIDKAYSAGIATKDDGVSFRPDANITREEMAVMISRVLKMKAKNTGLNQEQIIQKLQAFKDVKDISQASREAVAIAVDKKIINGRPGQLFAPGANATRAEGMVMIRRLLAAL